MKRYGLALCGVAALALTVSVFVILSCRSHAPEEGTRALARVSARSARGAQSARAAAGMRGPSVERRDGVDYVAAPPRTNRDVTVRSQKLAELRSSFTLQPRAESTPPSAPARPRPGGDEQHEISLAVCVLDTSAAGSGLKTREAADEAAIRGVLSRQVPGSRGVLPYIVQFEGPVREDWKQAVGEAGGILRGYLPNNAFIVEMTEKAVERVARVPSVQWIGEYKPEYKIQPFLGFLAAEAPKNPALARTLGAEDPSDRLMIEVSTQTFAPEDAEEVATEIAKAGGTVSVTKASRRWGLVRAKLPVELIERLANLGAVQWMEEYVPPTLRNDFAVVTNHMNVTPVWNSHGLTGYKQVVGHADTGLDLGATNGIHADFRGRIKAAYALGRFGDWSDTHGHGTHTAGSILGDGSASTGQFRGVAYQAQLVHQSVMDAGGGLGGIPADLNDLFIQAYDDGARIHSDSWGASMYGQYTVDSASADEFMWDYPDMLLVFSAGNDGTDSNDNGVVDPDSIGSPATAKNMLTVGAAENDRAPGSGGYSAWTWGAAWPSDYGANPIKDDYISKSADGTNQGLAAFSSRGPTDDGRSKPDIVAPGTDVVSCRSRAPGAGTLWGDHPNTNYSFCGGTSMSTPLTAGACALARQFLMDRKGFANPSAALIKATMLNGARSLTPGQYGTGAGREIPAPPRPNIVEGWGQVNLEETLFPSAPRKLTVAYTNSVATGKTNTHTISVGSTGKVCLTLAWTDYPGTAGAGKKLVNDLDLRVIGPTGSNYYPNGRTSADRTNNVEGIDILNAVSGVYTVLVSGFTVPQGGSQRYALVFSGGWEALAHTPLANTTNTVNPYAIDAIVTALDPAYIQTNTLKVCWNTNGSTVSFSSNALTWVANNTYRGYIPAQPSNTTVYYYLQGTVDGQVWKNPTNAPSALYSFQVSPPVTLVVGGAPAEYGTASPPYGTNVYASGNSVLATVSAFTAPTNDSRMACTGWVGTASAPASGVSNTASFVITTDSTLTWKWGVQYALIQTSSVAGILSTASWCNAGSPAQTVAAPTNATVGGTNYHLAYWLLDGVRQPDATNRAVNPVTGIAITTTSRLAVAAYVPTSQDADADGMADWWEYFHFGDTNVAAGGDADGDGYSNWQECNDGTDPRDASSRPLPPVISHTPLANPQVSQAPWTVTATVTDNCALADTPVPSAGLSFDGANDYVDAADAVYFNSNFTVEAWVFVRSVKRWSRLLDFANGAPMDNVFGALSWDVSGQMQFEVYRATATPGNVRTGTLPTNRWVHLAWVQNGTNATIYTNGAVWAAGSLGSPLGVARTNCYIGRSNWAPDAYADALFDEIRIWSTVRTQTEIRNNMQRALVGDEPGLVSYWQFNEGTDTNAYDSGTNHYDAAIYGATWTNQAPAVYCAITNVMLWWNRNGSGWQGLRMAVMGSNQFSAAIPAPGTNGDSFTYQIVAQDDAGLAATNGPHAFVVSYPVLSLAPTNFDVWLTENRVTNRTLAVNNSGGTDLVWQISTRFPASFLENVESGTNGWTHAGANDLWCVSAWRSSSPSHSWYCGDDYWGEYVEDMNCWLVSQPLWIGSGAKLSYGHWYSTESGYDYCYVQITTNNGVSYTTLSTYNGSGTSWRGATNDLSAYAGKDVLIRFRFTSDDSVNYEGWYVDDIRVWSPGATSTWLVLSFTTGVQRAGSGTNVVLTFNSAGMTNGDVAQARMTFACNDPSATNTAIPLFLRVGVPPTITHTPLANSTNTVTPYNVDATITPTAPVDTNSLFVLWNTNGLPAGFQTGVMNRVSGDLYRGLIPGQALGTRVYYYLSAAATNGLLATCPSNAPGALLSFLVVHPLTLTVTGTPVQAGTVVPGYGVSGMTSGAVVNASASSPTPPVGGVRYVCAGWVGSGSVPAVGSTNSLSFTSQRDSALDWQWVVQYGLIQTSSVPGIVQTTTWWYAGATTATIQAASVVPFAGSNYYFASWYLEGSRQPDATSRAVNPVTGIVMSSTHDAAALYLDEAKDEDGDGMADWWEFFYFGGISAAAGADADGDSFANLQEYQDRTDPRDGASVPRAPVITHVPLTSPRTAPAPWPVSATVTDNHAVSSVSLWWQRNGGGWQSAGMATGSALDVYTNTIPAPGTNGDSFAYRIEAQDSAGWASTTSVYLLTVAYPLMGLDPSSHENRWLMPGTTLDAAVGITNSGVTTLVWQVTRRSAGLRDDVESGANGWTHAGTLDQWRVSTNRGYSPTHAWYCAPAGTREYQDNMHCWLVSPPILLVQRARLQFRQWVDTEVDTGDPTYAYDGGIVELSTDGGTNYAQITPEGGYSHQAVGVHGSPFAPGTPCYAGTGGWQQAAFDLSTYAGQEIRFRFRFGSDDSFVSEGWYLDDLFFLPSASSNTSWLALNATNGSVAAGTGSNIVLTLNAAGMSNGSSEAVVLAFASNDPLAPTNRLPVSLFVGPPATIAHTPLINTTNAVIPYTVDADITPVWGADTNAMTIRLLWNTTGSTNAFTTNAMAILSNATWRGSIPAQPVGTHIYYHLSAAYDAAVARHPAGAPATLHHFQITGPATLAVAGTPGPFSSPTPPYGTNTFSVGNAIAAAAPDEVAEGRWYVCTGWTGSASVPAGGSSNTCAFTILTNSAITWKWKTMYRFDQTSSPAGIVGTSAWWNAGITVSTVIATTQAVYGTGVYRFAEWQVDGARRPDVTNQAVNPVTGIVMSTSRVATAVYLPIGQDADSDGLPDWWEQYYFGSTNALPTGDDDGDGFSNSQEYGEGTDPRNAASKPLPPVISHTPLADPQTSPAPWQVSATATDNVGLARLSVAGTALTFDGTNDYVICNPIARFPSNAITVEFWMSTPASLRGRGPISYATGVDALEFDLYHWTGLQVYRQTTYVDSGISFTDGSWHHVAVTWRMSDGQTCVYKDGVLAWSGTLAAGIPITPGGSLAFGNIQTSLGGGWNPIYAFEGNLDDFRIWNVARTELEIQSTMGSLLNGDESGLFGYWRFDEGTGTKAYDQCANASTGTISGASWAASGAGITTSHVTLWWNRNSNGWQNATMGRGTGDLYAAYVPAPGVNGDFFDYRIQAVDLAGIVRTNGPHHFHVGYPTLAVNPAEIRSWMPPDTVSNRFLSVSNVGVGALNWRLEASPVFFDGVESGTGTWTHAGANDLWHICGVDFQSASHSWHCGGDAGAYLDDMNCRLVTEPFVPAAGAVLSFDHNYDVEDTWDFCYVSVTTNGWVGFTDLASYTGSSGGWEARELDLSAYAGQEVEVAFWFVSDFSEAGFDGWFVDDVVVGPLSGSPASWLTLAPTNGILSGGTGTNVQVTVTSTGLVAGETRAATVAVTANDPNTPQQDVQILLWVAQAPVLQHTPLVNTTNTTVPYDVDATITPASILDANEIKTFWNTNGSTTLFSTGLMANVGGNLYRAQIPAQAAGMRVSYYVSAASTHGLVTRSPATAPGTLHSFLVTDITKSLTVTGTPLMVGVVAPGYGSSLFASGCVMTATATPAPPTEGVRMGVAGWTGSGSVPPSGSSNSCTFALNADSLLNWLWSLQYELAQSSTVAGIVNTSDWFFAGSSGNTVTASARVNVGGTDYRFAHWLVDGARWPGPTNVAENPAQWIPMSTARVATAVYFDESQDLDGDDMPDWWECFYFGSTSPWRDDDADGDGFTNLQEYRDGTNPRSAGSKPAPPGLSHTPLAALQLTPAPWPVTATATDNFTVAGVTLWYQRNGGAWQSTAMGAVGTSTVYAGAIPAPGGNGDHFVYRVEAQDWIGLAATNGPNAFDVGVPTLSVSPTSMENFSVPSNAVLARTLVIFNAGGGGLVWTIRVDQVGFSDDVESGAGAWAHGGAGDLWHISTRRSYSPTHAWYSGSEGTGLYQDSMDACLTSEAVVLAHRARLTFRQWISSELKDAQYAYDGGIVEMSTNNGMTYAQITPTNGHPYKIVGGLGSPFAAETPCFAGNGSGWQEAVFDLSAYANLTVRFRFRFGSDASKVMEGWYVDDIEVTPFTGPTSWLTVSPTNGTVAAYTSGTVNVSFDPAGLPVGAGRGATLVLTGNAPATPVIQVPVSMIVRDVDTDLDGMSDEWEDSHGLNKNNPADAWLDPDGDGFVNYEEYVADTDPTNATSRLYIMSIGMVNRSNSFVRFSSRTTRLYYVDAAADIRGPQWQSILSDQLGTGSVMSVTDDQGFQRRYYRVRVDLP